MWRGGGRAPGRPVSYGTTDTFLEHFGLDGVKDLPGLAELKGAGLLDSNLPPGFSIPEPHDSPILTDDEDPLDEGEEPLDAGADEPPLAETDEAGAQTAAESAEDSEADEQPALRRGQG